MKKTNKNDNGLPLGFEMALSRNLQAMNTFSGMSKSERDSYIEKSHNVKSKQEMNSLVDSITNNTTM